MAEKLEYSGTPIPIGDIVQRTATREKGVVQETFGDNSLANHPELPNLVPVLFEGESKNCNGEVMRMTFNTSRGV